MRGYFSSYITKLFVDHFRETLMMIFSKIRTLVWTSAAALLFSTAAFFTPLAGGGSVQAQTIAGDCLTNESITKDGQRFKMRAKYVCDSTGYRVVIRNGANACFSRGLRKNTWFTVYRPWYRSGYSYYKPGFNYGDTSRC